MLSLRPFEFNLLNTLKSCCVDLPDTFDSWAKLLEYCDHMELERETTLKNGAAICRTEPVHISSVIQALTHHEFRDMPRLAAEPPRVWFEVQNVKLFKRHLQEVVDVEKFFSAVPSDVSDAVRNFPERHYSLTSLCARCEGGIDLLYSTPALALMLANCWAFGRKVSWPLRSIRAQIVKKQVQQLEWLGFPQPSKSMIRILRKIPKKCCTIELLLYLRTAMQFSAARELLAHVTRINRGVIRVVSDTRLLPLASHGLLEEMGHDPHEDLKARLGWEMHHLLEMAPVQRPATMGQTPFRSIHDFRQRYAHLLEFLPLFPLCKRLPEGWNSTFPAPPVGGTTEIIPIRTFEELVDEGGRQHHCIASYASEIMVGEKYAYRVETRKERATLLLTNQSGVWVTSDCRGGANGSISIELNEMIESWLQAQQRPKQGNGQK